MNRTSNIPFESNRSHTRRGVLKGVGAAVWTGHGLSSAPSSAQATTALPVLSHPRIWTTERDLTRLRGWATDSNRIWSEGLLPLAEIMMEEMDQNLIVDQDDGSNAWNPYPTENSAEMFAFMSLVHPDETRRANFAERARTLLMHAINEAAKGPSEGEPFRDPAFSTFDRSRWWGEAFPVTVDWIYQALSVEDKEAIRTVFLRWSGELTNAATTTMNHPEPIGVVNDPILLADQIALRWAGNNYFVSHMRNLGLMALSFDAVDDPDGALTSYLKPAIGAWLYMADAILRGDSAGGLASEGFEYSQQALAYVVQFLLALETTGHADPDQWGPQVVLTNNPFWNEVIPAYLNSLSPVPVVLPELDYIGPVYQPAWYGDGQNYWGPDFIGLMGALGRYDDLTGNGKRLDAIRWIQTNLPPGGPELLTARVGGSEDSLQAISYFLTMDPGATPPADPRPDLPSEHFATGLGRLLARTDWSEDATWFTWALGWNSVDHQHGDGNQFEFYRQGEWLTKERTGYGFNIACSDYHNTLALENDPISAEPGDYRAISSGRGSQWMIVAAGDPEIYGWSTTEEYVYGSGDSTNLYNSAEMGAMDITHASRSVLWLKPDHIVVFDRAESATEGRYKRFWLNLPTEPKVDRGVTTMTTEAGQNLVITTLLPSDAQVTAEPAEPLEEDGEPAVGEPMQYRLRVEAPARPRSVRFFHVLQGTDSGADSDEVTYIEGTAGTPFVGAIVADSVVLFPIDPITLFDGLTYSVPERISTHYLTGLQASGRYAVDRRLADGNLVVSIRSGDGETADRGGVLVLYTAAN